MTNLAAWVNSLYNSHHTDSAPLVLKALTNDASFRKYYRFEVNHQSLIAVDSPPAHEKNKEFIAIQSILFNNHVNVPQIHHYNAEHGFFVIEDFGDNTLLPLLKKNPDLAAKLYQSAFEQLIHIQKSDICTRNNLDYKIPHFDQKILAYEWELFTDWFLSKYLGVSLVPEQNLMLSEIFNLMASNFGEQPQVLVHRDYHSRNLMQITRANSQQIGVIDFQDALIGPVTYDLISLLRDCYIAWPVETVKDWAKNYFEQAKNFNIIQNQLDFDTFWLWFLQTSLQRNFKAIGIFCRLYLRDKKPVYLGDIPRTLDYAIEASYLLATLNQAHTIEYTDLHEFLKKTIKPKVLNLTCREQVTHD